MEWVNNLVLGASVAFTMYNVMLCMVGVTIGTFVGVLPGLGPVATLSVLLPLTFALEPTGALIMLSGIYYGTQYGGSTAAILLNVPGDAPAVVTAFDGYPMALQGRAGAALAIAALASFFAGCVGTLAIAVAGPPLAKIAFQFRSPEFFSLVIMGLIMATLLTEDAPLKSVGMMLLGLLFGCIGTDVNSGTARYTFGINLLREGLNFSVLAVGLFAINEIIKALQDRFTSDAAMPPIGRIWITRDDFRRSWRAVLRGTGIGGLTGVLPGVGPVIASFAAYFVEKRFSKDPSRFGKGAVEGVASPEAANNMAAQTSFIPTLTLGLPGSATMVILLGVMVIHGIAPGPRIVVDHADLFWGLIVSMWLGNVLLVVLNLPLIPMWVRLLRTPLQWLWPSVILICCLGTFSLSNNHLDIISLAAFGALGFLFLKLNCSPVPLLMGFILGPMLEEHMRRSLLLSRGDPLIFLERPISLTLVLISAAIILHSIYKARKRAVQNGISKKA